MEPTESELALQIMALAERIQSSTSENEIRSLLKELLAKLDRFFEIARRDDE